MSGLVKFLEFVKYIGAMLRSFSWPASVARDINNDPIDSLDGALTTLKVHFQK